MTDWNAKLIPVTNDNCHLAEALTVTQQQIDDELILSVPDALKLASGIKDKARPFFIEIDDRIIGFTMFAFDEEIESPDYRYWLWQLMIDKKFQGQGYGNTAMFLIIDYFWQEKIRYITLSTKPGNTGAIQLYKKHGFKETGEWNDKEVILQKKLF